MICLHILNFFSAVEGDTHQARANYVHVRKRARNVHVKLIIVHEINVHVYVFHTNKPNSFFQLIVYTGVLFF